MTNDAVNRPLHGHHKLAASIFVGSLVVGVAIILSAELTKPERYEFQLGSNPATYIIYDRETGRAATADYGSKDPLAALKN